MADRSQASLLQDCISHIGHEQVPATLNAVFGEYCSPLHRYVFNTVELDLGRIPLDNFENEFLRRLEEKMAAFLSENLEWARQGDSTTTEAERWVEAFYFFLRHGRLPWWMPAEQLDDPEQLMDTVLAHHRESFLRFLSAEGRYTEVQERIVFQFREHHLTGIVQLVEPSHADLILRYADNLDRIHLEKPVIPDSARNFRYARWLFILQYLLTEKSSYFEEKAFLKSIIRQMAAHYGMAYHVLLFDLYRAAAALRLPSGVYTLPQVLRDVFLEEAPAELRSRVEPGQQETAATAEQQQEQAVMYFEYFLQYGTMPPAIRNYTRGQMEALFSEVLIAYPERMADVVRSLGVSEKVRQRIIHNFTPPFLMQIVAVLEPAHANLLHETADRWTEAHAGLQQENLRIPAGGRDFEIIKWSIILAYLLTEKGSRFNRKAFLRYMIMKTAAHYNMRYADLLQSLIILFSAADHTRPADLITNLLQEIAEEDKLAIKDKTRLRRDIAEQVGWTEGETEPLRSRLDMLLFYLETGSLPWWGQTMTRTRLPALFREIIQEDIALLVSGLVQLRLSGSVVQRLLALTDDRTVLLLLESSRQPAFAELHHIYLRLRQGFRESATVPEIMALRDLTVYLFFYLHQVATPDIQQVSRMAHEIARRHSLDTGQWLQRLLEAVRTHDRQISSVFIRLLFLLAEEETVVRVMPEPIVEAEKDSPSRTSAEIVQHPEADALEQYLLTGHLPSWAAYLSGYSLTALLERVWSLHPVAFRQLMLRMVKVPLLRRALVSRLEAQVMHRLSGFLFPSLMAVFAPLSQDAYRLLELLFPSMSSSERKSFFWDFVFGHLHHTVQQEGGIRFTSRIFVKAFWDRLMAQVKLSPLAYADETGRRLAQHASAFSPLFYAALTHELQRVKDEWVEKINAASQEQADADTGSADTEEEEPEAQHIYVHNAGLVILWPYWQTFFERLNMLENDRFKDADTAYRAVHLLQYMVTGHAGHPEYHLVLNKLICGVQSGRPVVRSVELTEDEMQLADDLLDNLIQQWTIVSNSDRAAIRESFLQRNGRISVDDDAIRLTVEKRGIDVLMDHLPWPISVIRLPWMNKPLYVSWR